jgi:hypothetical protein
VLARVDQQPFDRTGVGLERPHDRGNLHEVGPGAGDQGDFLHSVSLLENSELPIERWPQG